ncbi:BZ3500_MvSof-1268-A1-R1_Chr2-2g04901 [Microbotryum saponariae]|uniref:BZ3500_MvSof-1268-A1-R1_Chr2-2g04901 protein n=1 Tax=Microbotryum saponariae TaxID=289078 RepID=A0A2X0L6B4_9BASI|nr:BZ3500_MvSof-1268-A1-R1_Chr2-2g04901 [Microbotryum saponariae]SDA00440.1 BZ3501_MvSof-1269-A2-R1_Chr2-2g04575 [Microbotryum saponariae]
MLNSMLLATIQYYQAQMLRFLPSTIPTSLKVALVAWLAINFQTFPGRWHVTVLVPWLNWMARARLGLSTPTTSDPDPRTFKFTRTLFSGPGLSDAFGFHLSNSSYAWAADHVRGPHIYSLLPVPLSLKNVYFALGSTAFKFTKQIDIGATFDVTQELVAYDKKWANVLHHIVHNKTQKRTIVPARAIALAGFGEHGAANKVVVNRMTPKQRLAWLIGEDEKSGMSIKVGDIEMGMEGKSEWPGAVSA